MPCVKDDVHGAWPLREAYHICQLLVPLLSLTISSNYKLEIFSSNLYRFLLLLILISYNDF
jgi:hypothetical protein